jgi:hypothetical protein
MVRTRTRSSELLSEQKLTRGNDNGNKITQRYLSPCALLWCECCVWLFCSLFVTMLTNLNDIVAYNSADSPLLPRFVSGNDTDHFYSSDHFWSFGNVVPSYNIRRTVGWDTMLQAGRPWVRFPDESITFFSWPNPFRRTMSLGSTQPLTEMSIWNLPGNKGGRRVRLTTSPCLLWVDCLENVVATTSHNPMGLHGLLQR